MTENKYNVPKKLWKGFKADGQIRFNNLMDKTINSQQFFKHPKQIMLPQQQWKTICWNMACIAAWNAFEDEYTYEELPDTSLKTLDNRDN